jgi:hypothetical protein
MQGLLVRAAGDRRPINFDDVSGYGYLVGNAPLHGQRHAELLARLMLQADTALKAAAADAGKTVLAPELAPLLGGLGGPVDPYGQALRDLAKAIGQPDLVKDLSLTSPLGSGLVPYDLEAPAKQVYPAFSPLVNKLPRTKGQGTARRYKRITGISGSGTGGLADINPFLGESPSTVFGGLTLHRPNRISYAADEAAVSYKLLGVSDSVTWAAQWAGMGFQDVFALSSISLLRSMKMLEEKAVLKARSTALATPAAPTVAARSPAAGETAATGGSGSLYVKVTAVGAFGETAGSAAGSVTWAASQVYDVAIPPVPGAYAYRVYVSTGASDPGDSARYLAGETSHNTFTITGALPVSGATVPASDTGSGGPLQYDGILATLWASGGYTRVLNAPLSPTLAELDTMLMSLWTNVKADPEEIWVEGRDRVQISQNIINNSNSATGQAYRILLTPDEQGAVLGGAMVSSILNKVTGREVKLTVHPYLPQGTLMALSYTLPFAWSEVPNVIEVVNVQDYVYVDWPQIEMNKDASVILYGTLVFYAPAYCGLIAGIKPAS